MAHIFFHVFQLPSVSRRRNNFGARYRKVSRTSTNVDGMRRWGYIKLTPPSDRPHSKRPSASWLVELTPVDRMSQESWRPLPQLIEQRWRDRFGADEINSLRTALLEINQGLDVAYLLRHPGGPYGQISWMV